MFFLSCIKRVILLLFTDWRQSPWYRCHACDWGILVWTGQRRRECLRSAVNIPKNRTPYYLEENSILYLPTSFQVFSFLLFLFQMEVRIQAVKLYKKLGAQNLDYWLKMLKDWFVGQKTVTVSAWKKCLNSRVIFEDSLCSFDIFLMIPPPPPYLTPSPFLIPILANGLCFVLSDFWRAE